jgi:hypothetical protein
MTRINCSLRLKKAKAVAVVVVGACVIASVLDGYTLLFLSDDDGRSQTQSLRRGLLASDEQYAVQLFDEQKVLLRKSHGIDEGRRLKRERELRRTERLRALDPDAKAIAREYFATELKRLELERLQTERAAQDGMTDPESSTVEGHDVAKARSLESELHVAEHSAQEVDTDLEAKAVAGAGDAYARSLESKGKITENDAPKVIINREINAIAPSEEARRLEKVRQYHKAQEAMVDVEVNIIADADDSSEARRLDPTARHDARKLMRDPEVNDITRAVDAKRLSNRRKREEARRLEREQQKAEPLAASSTRRRTGGRRRAAQNE